MNINIDAPEILQWQSASQDIKGKPDPVSENHRGNSSGDPKATQLRSTLQK